MNEGFVIKTDIGICKYEYAYAVPGIQKVVNIYDKEGNFVPNTSKRKFGTKEYIDLDTKIDAEKMACEYLEEDVVYLGFMRGHWGHFLVDSSIRLWALDRAECRDKRILLNIEGMESFYKKLFRYLNIKPSQIVQLDKMTRFRSILVPDLSYFPEKYISKEYLAPFEKIANRINIDMPVYDKIYLSRVHFSKGKREIGEEDIQEIFARNGYHIIYPEELSLEEQVWYYKNCKSMVTTNGTIAHNILFANDQTELIILNRFEQKENMHQRAINLIKNIKVIYIDSYNKDVNGDRNDSLMWKTPEFLEFCEKRNFKLPKEKMGRKLYLKMLFRLPFIYRIFK